MLRRIIQTTLTLDCATPTQITLGETIHTSGTLSPPDPGATVTILWVGTSGDDYWRDYADVTTDANGRFAADYTPPAAGDWFAVASWYGDDEHLGSESETCPFTVTPP